MAKRSRAYTRGLDERLRDVEFAAEYLSAAAAEGKEEFLLALRDVVRARGMGRVARLSNRGRESLYKALSSQGNPRLDTLLSVLNATKIKLRFEAA